MSPARALIIEPLSAEAFAPFGDVISQPTSGGIPSNQDTAVRYENLANLDLNAEAGVASISLYHVQPAIFPLRIQKLERHPLSTQMFVPMGGDPFLVVVAGDADGAPQRASVRAFLTNGRQAVNYGRGVWHHPLIALGRSASFIMVGRRGPGQNFRFIPFADNAEALIEAF